MSFMKRVRLAVVLLVVGVLLGAGPARADRKPKPISDTYDLTLPEADPPEPQASGQLTLTTDWMLPYTGQQVNVSCRNLTPGNEYVVAVLVVGYQPSSGDNWGWWYVWQEAHTLTADRKGRLNGEFLVGQEYFTASVEDLWIWNAAGTLVLEWD